MNGTQRNIESPTEFDFNKSTKGNATRPLNVMFVITSMPVGGAETLLVNMIRQFDRTRIVPSVCCLKQKDELGELISGEVPVHSDLIHHKFDVSVVGRLKNLFRDQHIDAVVTVGAGDKMFWGRLAAWYARVPVILSALHSTGWPDGVGRLNRILTRITTGFIAVAQAHGKHLADGEGFPRHKVFVIPNGIDTDRFQFDPAARKRWRLKLNIPPDSPVVGIVAALRPEKNHALFLNSAAAVLDQLPDTHFVIVGDGPERSGIEQLADSLRIPNAVHLVGCTQDVPGILSMMDLFSLTSDNEASPVSIMEAMSCQRPVVATNVGSVKESVIDGTTGFLVPAGDLQSMTSRWIQVLFDSKLAEQLGLAARRRIVAGSSLDSMTEGYMELIEALYRSARAVPCLIPIRDLAASERQTVC